MKNKNLVEKDKYQNIWIVGLILTFCGALYYSVLLWDFFDRISRLLPSVIASFVLWFFVVWIARSVVEKYFLRISFIFSFLLLVLAGYSRYYVFMCSERSCLFRDLLIWILAPFSVFYVSFSVCSIIFWGFIFSFFPADKLEMNLKTNTRIGLLIFSLLIATYFSMIVYFLLGSKLFIF